MEARIMMFVVPGEHPNLTKTAETLATITGGRVTVLDTRPYTSDVKSGVTDSTVGREKKLIRNYYAIVIFALFVDILNKNYFSCVKKYKLLLS